MKGWKKTFQPILKNDKKARVPISATIDFKLKMVNRDKESQYIMTNISKR